MPTKFGDLPFISVAYKQLCKVCSQTLLDHPKCEGCGVLVGVGHLDRGLTGVQALVEPRHHIEGQEPLGVGLRVCRSCSRTVRAGRVIKL